MDIVGVVDARRLAQAFAQRRLLFEDLAQRRRKTLVSRVQSLAESIHDPNLKTLPLKSRNRVWVLRVSYLTTTRVNFSVFIFLG